MELLLLLQSRMSPLGKLLDLSFQSTTLAWSFSFLGLSLLSVYSGNFWFHLGSPQGCGLARGELARARKNGPWKRGICRRGQGVGILGGLSCLCGGGVTCTSPWCLCTATWTVGHPGATDYLKVHAWGPGQSTGQRREAGGREGGKLPFPVGSLAADAQLGGCKPKLESWKSWP